MNTRHPSFARAELHDRPFVRRVKQFVVRVLSRHCIFILGCQRSGTTLLYMMLTSHPDVVGRNEDEAGNRLPGPRELLKNLLSGKRTCYKAIVQVGQLEAIRRRFPRARLVWIVRHPYAVISSMRELHMDRTTSWLDQQPARELRNLANLFDELRVLNLAGLSPVSRGAYVWKYKAMAIGRYESSGFDQIVVRFEDLVRDPKRTLMRVLAHLGLKWDDQVLAHHRHHAGKLYLGNNSGDRPIDARVLERSDGLDDDEKARIMSICSSEMQQCNYA